MAGKLAASLMFFLFIIMPLIVLADHGDHTNATRIHEAPAPQPQPPSNFTYLHGITQGSLQPQDCAPRCAARCSKTQYKKPCLFFCQKCCAKCLCVPPGTYGNKQVCPCYNNWKTKRGGPKCP